MSELLDDGPEEQDDLVLQALTELERADKLEPEIIVAEGADPDSPFHTCLNWDDESAAHQHRLTQARQLIGRYRRIIIDGGNVEVRVRRFTHVPSQGRYMNTERALRDFYEEVMGKARRDLRTWQLRYDRLGRAAQLLLVEDVLGQNDSDEDPG